jgi:hypothetical protein
LSTDVILWVLLLIGPFLLIQRNLHREIQAVFLLIVRRAEIALAMFSLLFFPGVLLHEASHYLAALLLGVRVGRVSLLPKVLPGPSGKASRLQLGYVETGKADPLRDALIGAAPFLFGTLFVIYVGLSRLNLAHFGELLIHPEEGGLLAAITMLTQEPDFWLWFYLLFTVSSTMMPSASDRRAWLTVVIVAGLIVVLAILAGAGPWLTQNLAPYLTRALSALVSALSISLAVQIVLLLPAFFLHRMLAKATGLDVA